MACASQPKFTESILFLQVCCSAAVSNNILKRIAIIGPLMLGRTLALAATKKRGISDEAVPFSLGAHDE